MTELGRSLIEEVREERENKRTEDSFVNKIILGYKKSIIIDTSFVDWAK